jgi:hypothetical protein
MTYQTYSLTRVIDGGHSEFATSLTASDDDAINCAHMLAAGFNTMSRNFMGDFVLGVVNTKVGTVQYDGKVEKLDRPEPRTASAKFKFEPSVDADTILTLFGNGETPTFTAAGKIKIDEDSSATLAKSLAANVSRSVLEDAYVELQATKAALEEAGVETIPASEGVAGLRNQLAHEAFTVSTYEDAERQRREAAVAEMVDYVKRAHAKNERLQLVEDRPDLDDRWHGMLDVLAKFLVVVGEADADEGHAVARRLCGITEN